MAKGVSAEKTVRETRRKTCRRFSVEEKIRIVLEGLRGEGSIAGPLPQGRHRRQRAEVPRLLPLTTGAVQRATIRRVSQSSVDKFRVVSGHSRAASAADAARSIRSRDRVPGDDQETLKNHGLYTL